MPPPAKKKEAPPKAKDTKAPTAQAPKRAKAVPSAATGGVQLYIQASGGNDALATHVALVLSGLEGSIAVIKDARCLRRHVAGPVVLQLEDMHITGCNAVSSYLLDAGGVTAAGDPQTVQWLEWHSTGVDVKTASAKISQALQTSTYLTKDTPTAADVVIAASLYETAGQTAANVQQWITAVVGNNLPQTAAQKMFLNKYATF